MLCCKQNSWKTLLEEIIFSNLVALLVWVQAQTFFDILANFRRIFFQVSSFFKEGMLKKQARVLSLHINKIFFIPEWKSYSMSAGRDETFILGKNASRAENFIM